MKAPLVLFFSCLFLPVDALSQTTNTYTYDELGRLTSATDTNNGNRSFFYDAAGNRTSVQVSAVGNRAPVAKNDSLYFTALYTPTYINVLSNDTDPDGDTLTIVSYTTSGAVGVNSVNCCGFSLVGVGVSRATGTVTYTISDGRGMQATATVFTQNP